MNQITVNKLLAMEKSLRERLGQLNELKNQSTRETFWSETQKTEKPTYDIKMIDTKISKINRALFEINHTIKESNAKTNVSVDINYDELTSPIA